MPHPSITVHPKRSGEETRIEVRGWPGEGNGNWSVYTPLHVPPNMQDTAEWDQKDLLARARRLSKNVAGRSGLKKGRSITAYGWHRFEYNVAVAELLLHVEKNSPLLITHFNSSTDLIESERYAVRSFLLSCAADIADALQTQAGIDNGWVDWRVPAGIAEAVLKTAPGFQAVKQRRRPRRRGTDVILRRV